MTKSHACVGFLFNELQYILWQKAIRIIRNPEIWEIKK